MPLVGAGLPAKKPEIAAYIQTKRVIVDAHRGQARSHRLLACQCDCANAIHCRSEPARDGPKAAAYIQTVIVSVHDLRQQAGSYNGLRR